VLEGPIKAGQRHRSHVGKIHATLF
jgi:hypothetical protein